MIMLIFVPSFVKISQRVSALLSGHAFLVLFTSLRLTDRQTDRQTTMGITKCLPQIPDGGGMRG